MTEQEVRELIIREMAIELASKLMEFNKVIITKMDDGLYYCGVLDIIVPPTPKENLDAQP